MGEALTGYLDHLESQSELQGAKCALITLLIRNNYELARAQYSLNTVLTTRMQLRECNKRFWRWSAEKAVLSLRAHYLALVYCNTILQVIYSRAKGSRDT